MPVVKGMPVPNCGLLKALCWGFPSCRTRGGFLPILPFGTCNRPSSEGCGLEKGPPQTGVALSGPGQGRMSAGLGPQGRCDLDSKCTQVQRGQAGPVVCGPGHDQVCHLPVKIVQWPLGLTLDTFGSVPHLPCPCYSPGVFPWVSACSQRQKGLLGATTRDVSPPPGAVGGTSLVHTSSALLLLGWMARSCHPRAGGSPNLSMVASSQCPLTLRTLGQPVGPEMAWWALFRAVENLLGR